MNKKIKIKVTKKIFEKKQFKLGFRPIQSKKKIKIIFTFNLNGGGGSDMCQKLNKKNNKNQ